MSTPPKQSPKPLQWRLECLAHSLIEALAALLPGPALFRLGEALGSLAWHLFPERRRIVLRNLRIAYAGEMSPAALTALARASFRRTGGNIVSVARTARLNREQLLRSVELRGFEHIQAALAQGRGLLVLIPHMGNWEVLSRINLLMPESLLTGAFYRPLNNPLMDALVLQRREADGTRMFSKHDGPLKATGFLRENAMLGILADQRTGHVGETAPFFGRITRASQLPSLLARRVKCPVVSLSNITLAPGHWRIEFCPVAPPYTTASCMMAMETLIKSSPADYFWLQDRWKLYFRKGRTIRDWLGEDETRGSKPHRALLWLPGTPDTWRIPDAWTHPDVTYEAALTATATLPAWLPGTTRIHRVTDGLDKHTLRQQLTTIDAAAPLPLDYILTATKTLPKTLTKAANHEHIPLVHG